MAALVAGKNGEEMSKAAASGVQKAVEETRMTVDGWGGMRIGEANRLYKDNLTAVTVTKAGDSRFAAAKACCDRLCAQFPVSEAHQAKLVVHAFSGQAARCSNKWQRLTRLRLRLSCGWLWNGVCTMSHRFRISVESFMKHG
jgi:hypothetical protein